MNRLQLPLALQSHSNPLLKETTIHSHFQVFKCAVAGPLLFLFALILLTYQVRDYLFLNNFNGPRNSSNGPDYLVQLLPSVTSY